MRFSGMRMLCVFGLAGVAGLAAAQAAPPDLKPAPAAAGAGRTTQARQPVAGFGTGVAPALLAGLSGGTDVHQRVTINGSVSNTSTTNVSTGFNAIGGGAFGHAVGLPMVIQNSGNSVLIQNATVVNVQMKP